MSSYAIVMLTILIVEDVQGVFFDSRHRLLVFILHIHHYHYKLYDVVHVYLNRKHFRRRIKDMHWYETSLYKYVFPNIHVDLLDYFYIHKYQYLWHPTMRCLFRVQWFYHAHITNIETGCKKGEPPCLYSCVNHRAA